MNIKFGCKDTYIYLDLIMSLIITINGFNKLLFYHLIFNFSL